MTTAESRKNRAAAVPPHGSATDGAAVEAQFLKSVFAELCGAGRPAAKGLVATADRRAPARPYSAE